MDLQCKYLVWGDRDIKNTTKDPKKIKSETKNTVGCFLEKFTVKLQNSVTAYLLPKVLTPYLHLLTGEGAVNF